MWEASCAMVVVAEYRGEEIQLEVTQPPGELPVMEFEEPTIEMKYLEPEMKLGSTCLGVLPV